MTEAPSVEIRPSEDVDADALLMHVVETWHGESVVAHGERIYPARLAGFVALIDGDIAGHVTYRADGDRCEITSIDASPERAGIGSRLLEVALDAARDKGCSMAWLTTTNDNLDAIRFYQRRGFRLARLRPGAVDSARAMLKPELPVEGSYRIPMRDELDLERDL